MFLAVDASILVAAHRREALEHELAQERVRQLAEGPVPWAIPWPCLFEFHSVVTNPRIWQARASSPAEAWAQVAAWTAAPGLKLLGETAGSLKVLKGLLDRPTVKGPAVHDARVAALGLAHAVDALLSHQRDFSPFPELTVEDPFGRPLARAVR